MCPTGTVALDRSSGDANLYSKTIQLTGGSAASGTGPTPGAFPGRAIRMTSSAPVSVATMAHASTGSGASIVLPTNTLGTRHRIVLLRRNPAHHFLVLAAGAAATTITLTGASSGVLPFNSSGIKTVTLQPYDTYYIRAGTSNTTSMSGMLLDGTQPFAVIAGATCKSFTAGRCRLSATSSVFHTVMHRHVASCAIIGVVCVCSCSALVSWYVRVSLAERAAGRNLFACHSELLPQSPWLP